MIQPSSLVGGLLKNTLFTSLSRFISGITGFILTPFLLKYLGLELFGVWGFLFVLIAYINLIDLALAETTTKFTAQYASQKNYSGINTITTFALVLHFGVFLLLLALLPFISPWLNQLLSLPNTTSLTVSQLVLAALAYSAATKLNNTLLAVYTGLQRFELVTLNQLVYSLLLFCISLLAIFTHKPLLFIIWVPFVAQLATFLAQNLLIRSTLPHFQLRFNFLNKKFLRRALAFGSGFQATVSAHTLNTQITKTLIATLGFHYLGIYELGFKAVAFLKSLPTVLLTPMFPAITHLDTVDREKRNRLIDKGTKYLAFLTYPVFFLSLAFAPELLKLWLGEADPIVVLATRLLLLAFLPDTLIGVITTTLNGIGRVFVHVEYALTILVLHTAAFAYLLTKVPFETLLYILPLTVLVASIWILGRFSRQVLPLTLRFVWRNWLHSGLVAGISLGLTFVVLQPVTRSLPPLLTLLLAGTIFGFMYLGGLIASRFFSPEDRKQLQKLFGRSHVQ